ncbi:UNVERIFIED_CONTAM: hypothetical protein DES50_101311 [Williamsia faeni]
MMVVSGEAALPVSSPEPTKFGLGDGAAWVASKS